MSVETGVVITGESSFRIEPEKLVKCPRCGQTATKMRWHVFCPHCDEVYHSDAVVQKEYPEILDKLEQFASEKYQTRIFSFDGDWHKVSFTGCIYDVAANVIFTEPNLPHNQRITGIAHEIGHAIDFFENFKGDYDSFMTARENDIYKNEKTAWANAEKILEKFDFSDWEYFESHKTASLKSYREND